MRIINRLSETLRNAAVFNPEVQAAPACILWPDRDRQWEAVIPRLQCDLPELLILGDYQPELRTGPAIWLRCVMACKVTDVLLPQDRTPIIYLPSISRQELRAVEQCPDHLKPLAELQYRGMIWSQKNHKDWTILAFLKCEQVGLGLDVPQDHDTKNALQLALSRLLDEQVDHLKGKRLDKDVFNTLLTGGDPVRDLLQWLDQSDAFRSERSEHEWNAFVAVCKSQFAFDPEQEGVLEGAAKLAAHEGPWRAVWDRYCETPTRYPNIPGQIRGYTIPDFDLFQVAEASCGWPQWNEDQESILRGELKALAHFQFHDAQHKLLQLEKQHGKRRDWVWAELGEAPLAQALEHLAVLAKATQHSLAAGTVDELAATYAQHGWKADDAVMRSLAAVEKAADVEAISVAIRSVYLPWAEAGARHLQKIVDKSSYPGGSIDTTTPMPHREGECVFFVDGLRFDAAKRLVDMLVSTGFEVAEQPTWAALPSVTATGKAAVSPVRDKIRGEDTSTDFEPCVVATGKSLKGGYHFKKLLVDEGWTILDRSDHGDGKGNAWCECGNIDHDGHDRGWKLAKHLDGLLKEIHERVAALLAAGWSRVRVVTDHGWLLVPGELPKIDLSGALTATKWGRCAVLKPGAATDERLYPWFWNPSHHFALADGVSCFRKGEDYAHGGLSLQECLTLELIITSGSGAVPVVSVVFTDVDWKGLRCTVAVDGPATGLSLDVRTQPGNALSSVVVSIKPFKRNGTASVVVENEELEGQAATLVLLDANGKLVRQEATVIGGTHA
jgi:hypothetical protein